MSRWGVGRSKAGRKEEEEIQVGTTPVYILWNYY
jgi:hypothetical protein